MADEKERKETDDGSDNNIQKKRNGDTKLSLTLRMVVAAYVLYLAYGLIRDFGKNVGNDRFFIGAAIIFFVVAGGALLILSARKLIRKEYIDAEEDGNEKQ